MWSAAVPEVLPHLPIEGGLHRVLDRERPALDEEVVRELRGSRGLCQRVHELRQVRSVEIGIADLDRGCARQAVLHLLRQHAGVVVADRIRAVETGKIQVLFAAE